MKTYKFEIQAYQEIIVEADNVEDARMMIIDHEVDTLLNCSSDDVSTEQACVSDGEEVK